MSLRPTLNIGTISNVAEAIMMARQGNRLGRTIFFIGAGCSVSAGVPAVPDIARRMIHEIAVKFGFCQESDSAVTGYRRLLENKRVDPFVRKSVAGKAVNDINDEDVEWHDLYDHCFDRYFKSPDDVRDLFSRIIAECQGAVNWAHLCLGELAEQRLISTVLTTNFDQLILSGMTSAGLIPVVCDGIESLNRLSSNPSHQQLVELHGSRHTYRLLNRPAELVGFAAEHRTISSILGLFGHARAFVVVGYGGREQGVMDLLIDAAKAYPDKNIFWTTYGEADSLGEKAREFLSTSANSAVIPHQDADLFFLRLSTELGVGLPRSVRQPLVRYAKVLEDLKRSRVSDKDIMAEVQRAEKLLDHLHRSEGRFEASQSEENMVGEIRSLRLSGRAREALDLAKGQLDLERLSAEHRIPLLEEFVTCALDYAAGLLREDVARAGEVLAQGLEAGRSLAGQTADREILLGLVKALSGSADALIAAGAFDLARAPLAEATPIAGRLHAADAGDAEAAEGLATIHELLGAIERASSNLPEAISHFEESLQLRVALAGADHSPERRQNLCSAYDRLGEVMLDKGDLPAAKGYFENMATIQQGLVEEYPETPRYRREWMVGRNKLAHIAREENDLDRAKELYQQGLETCRSLVADFPGASEYERDLAIANAYVADMYSLSDDPARAKEHYLEAERLFRRLADANPGNRDARVDVVLTLGRIGELHRLTKELQVGKRYCEEALAAQERIPYFPPRALGDLYVGYADLLTDLGAFEEAYRAYQQAVQICERRIADNADDIRAHLDLAYALSQLAAAYVKDGRREEARAAYRRAIAGLTAASPLEAKNPEIRTALTQITAACEALPKEAD